MDDMAVRYFSSVLIQCHSLLISAENSILIPVLFPYILGNDTVRVHECIRIDPGRGNYI